MASPERMRSRSPRRPLRRMVAHLDQEDCAAVSLEEGGEEEEEAVENDL